MAMSREERIAELFVKVEIKMDSIVQLCDDAEKAYESAEWDQERRLTLQKFDAMVKTAEGNNEAAKDLLIRALKSCLYRVCFAHKLAEFGIFVVFDGPGKVFPVPGFVVRLLKGGEYEKL
ncbi:hypothetical protein CRE_04266 [Caenorhabditis remanei]|uniref:Uncharacterized protein n=2 Tax=Caenorhabditis remanei TaxID=31234 RepID=E3NAP9_CAERE|nr:hypothetical protein CRE_04266 [Caenorhabditis remanei]